ncbi:mitochondrial 37S ribosomal protein rsm10 [Claviceps citrina]|nr:mitochondrial 37S ribosomal protein rsm10 [Claviceps citrina]
MLFSPTSRPLCAIAAEYGCRRLTHSSTHSAFNRSFTSLSPKREQDNTAKVRPYTAPSNSSKSATERDVRLPRSLQAIHLKPLKREAEFGIPSCDLQMRSFSVQPLEFFSDFALRAAYYLGLPAYGPVPLPRITERWTVPKSHFIFKKAQENFERITFRRMIQIRDGHPETVQLWLSYLRKHQFYGVGMKANVWEFGPPGADVDAANETREKQLEQVDSLWSHLGQTKSLGASSKVEELLSSRRSREANGLRQPLSISGGK